MPGSGSVTSAVVLGLCFCFCCVYMLFVCAHVRGVVCVNFSVHAHLCFCIFLCVCLWCTVVLKTLIMFLCSCFSMGFYLCLCNCVHLCFGVSLYWCLSTGLHLNDLCDVFLLLFCMSIYAWLCVSSQRGIGREELPSLLQRDLVSLVVRKQEELVPAS